MIRKLKENEEPYLDLDSKEYRADRMLDYLEEFAAEVEKLSADYYEGIRLNGSIEPGLYQAIEKLYRSCEF